MKTLIVIPSGHSCPMDFAISLATLRKVGECQIMCIQNSLIYDARNKLAIQAIKLGVDYVLWLDSDMTFPPDIMEKLMVHMKDKDIVSGLYFRRIKPFTPVIFKSLELTDDGCKFEGYDDYPSELFDCKAIGFGCVLLKTSVLVDVVSNYGTFFNPMGGVGEDMAFCHRATELGYKIWVDPNVKLGHESHTIVTEDFYRVYRESKK